MQSLIHNTTDCLQNIIILIITDVYIKPGYEQPPEYPTMTRSASASSSISQGSQQGPLLPPRPPQQQPAITRSRLKSKSRLLMANTQSISSIFDLIDGEDLEGQSTDSVVDLYQRKSQTDKPLALVPPSTKSSSPPQTDEPPPSACRRAR